MGVTFGGITSATSVSGSDTIVVTQGGTSTRKATVSAIVAAGGGGGGAMTLEELTDVNISSVTNGQALAWNSATSKWTNQTISGGGGGPTLNAVTFVSNSGYTVVNNTDGSQTITPTGSGAYACTDGSSGVSLSPGDLYRFRCWIYAPGSGQYGGHGVATANGLSSTFLYRHDGSSSGNVGVDSYNGSDVFTGGSSGGTNDVGFFGNLSQLSLREISIYVITDGLVAINCRGGGNIMDLNKNSFGYGSNPIVPAFSVAEYSGGSYTIWGAAWTHQTGYDVYPW